MVVAFYSRPASWTTLSSPVALHGIDETVSQRLMVMSIVNITFRTYTKVNRFVYSVFVLLLYVNRVNNMCNVALLFYFISFWCERTVNMLVLLHEWLSIHIHEIAKDNA